MILLKNKWIGQIRLSDSSNQTINGGGVIGQIRLSDSSNQTILIILKIIKSKLLNKKQKRKTEPTFFVGVLLTQKQHRQKNEKPAFAGKILNISFG